MSNSTEKSSSLTIEEIRDFKGTYPKQLWYLFTVEMWERFCFYGMRGILVLFMVDQFTTLTDSDANLKYGAIQAFIYAFTFIGGIFADKVLGFNKSLIFGALMMILGNILIAVSPHDFFFLGIALSIIGTGFFKPNISSMVGELYNEGDPRRDTGFSAFYSGINIGALLGGGLCVWLGMNHGWDYAFAAAATVMVLGLSTFLLTKKHLGPIGMSPLKKLTPNKRLLAESLVYIGAIASIPLIFIMIENTRYTDFFMYIVGPIALIYFGYILLVKVKDRIARRKLIAAFILTLFSIVFFAFFEQAGGSLALFAKYNLKDELLGISGFFNPNMINNQANSLFVIIFSPLIGLLWLALDKKRLNPNTVVKFGIGFILLSASFFVFYACRFFADENGMTSLNVFTAAYLVITLAELCISPIGLSMITKLSPHNLAGMMMGMWFLASAYGQYVAGLLGAGMSGPHEGATTMDKLLSYTNGYYQLAIYAAIAAVLLFVLSKFIRSLMHEVK